ncbi:MAG: tyrosine-type recombinase/integrase, partial [Kiloniellales bacterium]
MKAKLTDRSINRAAPKSGTLEIWDTACPGLALRIHAGGKRSYCVTTRLAGHFNKKGNPLQIRRTIGTTASHGLREARDAALAIIRDAAKGLDSGSREAKQEAARLAKVERERATANSFRAVVEGYLADNGKHGGGKMKSKDLVEQRLENHAMDVFGERPIDGILRSEVRDLLRGMVTAGKPVAANRLLGNLKRVFKWAVLEGKLEGSPIADMDKLADEQSRDRVLTDVELAVIWAGCEKLSKAHGGAIKLMLLTGARRNEASGLLRSEIQGDEWHLPAARSKNSRPHIWHLTDLAQKVIAGVPQIDDGDPVFSLDGEKPVNGWSKIKARLDGEISTAGDKVAHWTLHDLRRTLVTRMNEALAVPPHVVEACVNHVSGSKAGVAGTYNRATYMPQRR